MYFSPQFPALSTDVFPTDMNAGLTLVTVPAELLASYTISVAPAISNPVKSHLSQMAILSQMEFIIHRSRLAL